MYCAKCQRIVATRTCRDCGSDWVREAGADDICYLVEKEQIWAEMLEEVLRQNGIPFLIRHTLGAGITMSVGAMLECHKIYVPFETLDQALAIVDELFPTDAGEGWSGMDEAEQAAEEDKN